MSGLTLNQERKGGTMFNLKFMSVIFAGVLLAACTQEGKQDSPNHAGKEQAAVQSAEIWVALVDEGKYGESWDEAAGFFKNALPKDKWVEMLGSSRPTFGKVLQRNVKSQAYKTSLPGAPDGEYVIIQFETKFEHKARAIETVTPSKEKDGSWRVSGYYIK
jgi:hypothetical protein